jgi:uncharacterized protein
MKAALPALVTAGVMLCWPTYAEPLRGVINELGGSPDPAARVERISASARSEVDVALAEYDEQVRLQPFDVTHRIRRCSFIDEFMLAYEYSDFMAELDTLSRRCREELSGAFGEHPEVRLFELSSTYGEELIGQAEELLQEGVHQKWTAGQLARLYTMLASAFNLEEKPNQALDFALRALELDEESDVRLIAATHLVNRGERERALAVLTSPIDTSDSDNGWSLVQKMDLLAQLGAADHVQRLHSKLTATKSYSHLEAARALRLVGAASLARRELELAAKSSALSTADDQERFKFELEFGTGEQALAAYQAWRDAGWAEDPIGINRLALAARDLSLPWRPRDFTGILGFLGALAALALIAAIPVAAVHYRGLADRARTGAPYPTAGWQLRDAWTAMFAFGIAALLSLYTVGALDLMSYSGGFLTVDATPKQLAPATLADPFLGLVILVPLAMRARARGMASWNVDWSIWKCLLLGAALGLALRIPFLAAFLARPEAVRMAAPNDAVWQLVGAVRDQYGMFAALWVLAIAAPVIEEFVFRGVLYRAFTAHIGAGWANAVQAALFSAMHFNLKATFFLFVLGLVLGTLTRRSGGLAAPMMLHACFNLVAGLLLL